MSLIKDIRKVLERSHSNLEIELERYERSVAEEKKVLGFWREVLAFELAKEKGITIGSRVSLVAGDGNYGVILPGTVLSILYYDDSRPKYEISFDDLDHPFAGQEYFWEGDYDMSEYKATWGVSIHPSTERQDG